MSGGSGGSGLAPGSYLDFDIEVGAGRGRTFPVEVRGPAGETRGALRFPYDRLALESRLKDLRIALLQSGGRYLQPAGGYRRVLSPEELPVREFGGALFDALLAGEVRGLYDLSRLEATKQGKGLRLRLRIQAPALAALPWEFLYDSRHDSYVCLSSATPLVRYPEVQQPVQPLAVAPPLRILGLASSPSDLAPLKLADEQKRIGEALTELQARRQVELTWLEGHTWRALRGALRRGPWHVLYFIGHGGFDARADEGLVVLEDDRGQSFRLWASQLGQLLADHHTLRLVVLNACEGARGSDKDIFSGTAAALVRKGIPAALAMQYEISDDAAIEFARGFFEALADGSPVDAAVADARIAVWLNFANTVEWGTPVLYLHALDGRVFDLTPVPPVAPPRDGGTPTAPPAAQRLTDRAPAGADTLQPQPGRAGQGHPPSLGGPAVAPSSSRPVSTSPLQSFASAPSAPPAGYADLLIRVGHRNAGGYDVETQFSGPGSTTDIESEPGQAAFDVDALEQALGDGEAYGRLLTQCLFADPKVSTAFTTARTTADALSIPLRMRLLIDEDAPELHALRWETLRDPRDGTPITTSARVLFSRYLRSPDWRPIRLRPLGDLRALVLIADPTDISRYAPEGVPLQPLDVPAELARATEGLSPVPVTALATRGQATLSALYKALSEQAVDVVYLVCHGSLVRERPVLYLEDEQGRTDPVEGAQVAAALAKLVTLPTLVVLASTLSAGSGGRGALAALGPDLSHAGVPAVLAMQDRITVETSGRFMRRFFVELGRDGQLDRAVAVARDEVRDRPDYWTPVLFTRLRGGSIWRTPPVRAEGQEFGLWRGLLTIISRGRCIPILGPGVIEFLIGSHREIARRWAADYRFPLSPHDRESLAQVAQFVAVDQRNPELPRDELERHARHELYERYGRQLPESLRGAHLDALISEVGRQRRAAEEAEPHRVLASLPLPIYLTTNPDNLLAEALAAAGKDPQVVLCRWNEDRGVDWPASAYDLEPDYRPNEQRPLVVHLFGQFRTPGSVVLTADDYYNWLLGVTRADAMPADVCQALDDAAVLLLGIDIDDDLALRVLLNGLLRGAGGRRPRRVSFIQAIDPEEGRSLNPQRAVRYFEEFFRNEGVSIYWGSLHDFIEGLRHAWRGVT